MKLTFALKKLVNSYPITLIFILLLLSSITAIFIQSHVYAMSEKSNTPGCECKPFKCPKSSDQPPSDPNHPDCHAAGKECYCSRAETFIHCYRDIYNRCKGTIQSGCNAGNPCSESDCYDDSGCGGNGCPNNNCGTCQLFELSKDPDVSKCYKSHPFCANTYLGCSYKFSKYVPNYLP